ncbi:MAG TPA: SH3 domain-containing protein [Stellaceae bacterium]|nr:SH3 domain-containing protein [Stellaceae bacterium]
MACGGWGRAAQPLGIAFVVGALSLCGCSSTGGAGLFSSYSVAADDTCGTYKTQLSGYRDFFFSSMIEGAAVGAGVGALSGYLIGGSTQSTLIGAGAGAVVGGATGYYLAKQKAANGNQSALTDSVYQDLSRENSQIDGVTQAFDNLRDCRIRSAQQVKADLDAQRISRDEAQARLAKVRGWLLEDIDFADALGAKMGERGNEYAEASNQMLQADPAAKQILARRESAAPAAAAGTGGLVAAEAARVREDKSASSRQIASLTPGEPVTVLQRDESAGGWTQVRLNDGRTGYVASRLLRPAGARGPTARTATASAAPPPKDVAGVAQLTESNQLKRKTLGDDIAQAKTEANGSAFQLSGSISRAPEPRLAA